LPGCTPAPNSAAGREFKESGRFGANIIVDIIDIIDGKYLR
jgi:hypothetical protein